MTTRRRILVATGSRAEFGLLVPVIDALVERGIDIRIAVMGAHLLPPSRTADEVRARYSSRLAGEIPMQHADETGRLADAAALGRGVCGVADLLGHERPDVVIVLGDRIEALAAACAASIAGIPVMHLHGGDRAEGVADEAMRHAISKLAHIHGAATPSSAQRLIRMGEDTWRVHVVGSPAIDGLDRVPALPDDRWAELGMPGIVVLHHPTGLPDQQETAWARAIADALKGERALWLAPNFDPGRDCVLAVRSASRASKVDHLERPHFVALLRRLAIAGGVLVGNSSAGLIEAAALSCPAVDVGPRQSGRERADNVIHVDEPVARAVRAAIETARRLDCRGPLHPYGDGRAGARIAALLGGLDLADPRLLRKRNTY